MKCKGCGKEFKPTHGNQRYHDKACQVKANNKRTIFYDDRRPCGRRRRIQWELRQHRLELSSQEIVRSN